MTDTLRQIQNAKRILSKKCFIDKTVSITSTKSSLKSLLMNYNKNKQSEIQKANYRHNSFKNLLPKTVSKTKSSAQCITLQEEPKQSRHLEQKFVSNSTQIPSNFKINVYLNNNNMKGLSLSLPSKHYESSTISSKNQGIAHDKETVNESRCYSVYSSNIIEEYSYKEDKNIWFKETMEDKGKSIDAFNSNRDNALFCLYDGHGGDAVSLFLQKYYPFFFKKSLEKYKGNIEEALKMSFITIDIELKALEYVKVGSTGCVVYITKEKSNIVVYCANIGDTRASIIKPLSNEYKRISYDHRADDPKEKKRIIYQGGMILNNRVMGQLMLTRAFGDFELKGFGVKSEPFISKTILSSHEKNQFLFIASDGVWDVINEREIQKFLSYTFDTEAIVDKILSCCTAKKLGTI